MFNHLASFETIIESVDALSPAELDALQARIARSRQKQAPATKKTSERSIFEIPFVFVPKPLIEESTWSALDEDDFYPTLTFSVAGKDQEGSATVKADLDTGSPHLFNESA